MVAEQRETIHILLVEESLIHSALIEDLLRHNDPQGFQVTSVHSLSEAEQACRGEQDFEVILLDLVLPDCQGLQTLDRMLAIAPHTPIVVVTNIDDKTIALDAVQRGAQDFLVKGAFTDMLLTRTIRYAIERQRIQEQLQAAKLRAEDQARNVAQLNAQLEAVNEELTRLDGIKSNFLSTVSHELRTPLTIIKGALSNLADGIVGEMNAQQQRIVDISHRNIDRLSRLINDLLDLSRLESGRVHMHPRKMCVRSVIGHAVHDMQVRAQEHGVTLLVDLPESLPALYADADMLTQVMNNLLANALRFAKKRVLVQIHAEADGVRVTVNDDGEGIAADDVERVFNKFEQVNRPEGGAGYKGTGLGLAICKEIMRKHRGNIWVESAEGKGASFHCFFPLYNEHKIICDTINAGIERARREDTPFCVLDLRIQNYAEIQLRSSEADAANLMHDMQEHMLDQALRQDDRITACEEQGRFIIEAQVTADGGRALKERLLGIMQRYMIALAPEELRPNLAIGMAMCPDDGIAPEQLLNKAASNLQQPKVLVIDDEQSVLDMLSMLLKTTDFDVEIAHDGVEGLAMVESYDPDIIVLDIIMPNMDGWEVCQRLRSDERTRNKPIFMLTASSGRDLEERAASFGAQLLQKPYDNQQIISLLRDAPLQ